MFGLFKKNTKSTSSQKQKTNQSTPAPESKKQEPEVTPNEALQAIAQMQKELDRLKLAISGGTITSSAAPESDVFDKSMGELEQKDGIIQKSANEKVIEGVFDGQSMVGADGQIYDVPANYASKSKLVEGDILKLTINNLGAFVYKQIKPIERERKVGILEQDSQNMQYYAVQDGKKWKLLNASVTYFKGEPGDEIVFLVPEDGESRWAAVENIVRE